MPRARRRPDRDLLRKLLAGEDAFATSMFLLFVDLIVDQTVSTLGPDAVNEKLNEALQWHPAAIQLEMEEQLNVRVSATSRDRLMAAISVVTTDLFFKSAPTFIVLANVLAGDEFDPAQFDPADSAECAWAVTEALILNPPDDEDPEPFADEVRAYIGRALKEEGYVTPPDILKIALDADFSAQVTYDFADDPEMFQGLYEVQRGKTAEVEAVIRDNLAELLEQVRSLPLRRGDTSEFEERILAVLRPKEEPA